MCIRRDCWSLSAFYIQPYSFISWSNGNMLRMGGQGRKCAFSHFPARSLRMDGQTDGRTDGRTDKAFYRVACPQLKRIDFQTSTLSLKERRLVASAPHAFAVFLMNCSASLMTWCFPACIVICECELRSCKSSGLCVIGCFILPVPNKDWVNGNWISHWTMETNICWAHQLNQPCVRPCANKHKNC